MNKGQRSLYTAISSLVYTFIYSLLSLIVIRLVITAYGSDFNGVNSSANQFIGVLLILEGGFTMAINVSLFKPIVTQDIHRINSILSAANRIFTKIGALVLIIGIVASVGYSFLVKSNLSWHISALTFVMVVIPTAFNLAYATKYVILLQSEQREYLVNSVKTITIIFSQVLIIIIVYLKAHMLFVRFASMVGVIFSSVLIAYVCKKKHNYLNFNEVPDYSSAKGTKDVIAQKITGVIYGTVPILFISATVGTLYASVFAVYSGIFMLLKNVISAFSGSPKMGFGQLIAEREKSYVKEVFVQYEFIVVLALLCLLSVAVILIMPFITLYTDGVSDINYLSWPIAGLFVGISFFEIIHLPSGNILNMAGLFRTSRNFQILTAIVLIVSMIVGNYLGGFIGILGAVLVAAILLAFLEISYIHFIYFEGISMIFIKHLLPNLFFSVVLIILEINLLPEIKGYLMFAVVGILLVLINGGFLLGFNYFLNKSLLISLLERFHPLVAKLNIFAFFKKPRS